jgi:hemerythrin-like domain-containing protein
MNSATENLENDHIHIMKLIDVMQHITGMDDPDTEHIEIITDIIRNFADGLHHAKEENLFFPYLATKGFSAKQGPVAVMLSEHVQGRNFVKGISDNLALYRNGDKSALAKIYQNMSGYASLLTNHIAKENNILFRMADNALNQDDHAALLARFRETEVSHYASHDSKDYAGLIRSLATHYNI